MQSDDRNRYGWPYRKPDVIHMAAVSPIEYSTTVPDFDEIAFPRFIASHEVQDMSPFSLHHTLHRTRHLDVHHHNLRRSLRLTILYLSSEADQAVPKH